MAQNEVLEQLQVSALAHAAHGDAEAVFSVCDVADFEPGFQQDIASIITSLMQDGAVDPMRVLEAVSRQAKGPLTTYYTTQIALGRYGSPAFCAGKVREAANHRRVTATVTRAYQQLTATTTPVESIIGELISDLEVDEAHLSSGLSVVGFEDMLDTPDESRPWVMPGMFRTNERLVVTGPEGGGKSVLMAQLCLGAAMGVNTLSPTLEQHEPMRVLMLDVENDRLQIKGNIAKVHPYLSEISGGVKPLIEWVDVRDIDLSDNVERQKIVKLAKERRPQMLYMGSLYKLAPEGDKADAAFTAISRTVDRIRAETGSAVLLEGHAGHGMMNDRNGMRPYGSSMWLRWPEFGIGMAKHRGSGHMKLTTWRGHRSDDRAWPGGLRRGSLLPWQPIPQDEWDARYEDN